MTAQEQLDLLFEQNNGILKTAQILEMASASLCSMQGKRTVTDESLNASMTR